MMFLKLHFLLYLFISILVTTSCSVNAKTQNPEIVIVYEVFIPSFCDSNKDGIGDIPGLISKLDYIRDLGISAIWISPVHPSPSYHKYDVNDYYAIDPHYGTMEDMERLIRATHQRGMKLIFDLVINHTSTEHPWFVASASSPKNPYRNYYVWKDFNAVEDEINKKTTTFDSDNITQWHKWHDEEECYYGFFWKGMPDLNFDNPDVRKEVYKVGKFWLDKGIDGFRLDAARHIFPDDRLEDTRKFWEEFRTEMEAVKPDISIVGEVWSDPSILVSLFKGLPSLFNFELTKSIPETINSGMAAKFEESYRLIDSTYHTSQEPFEDAILLSNHDMDRIRSKTGSDIEKAKLAASILLTLPGIPYLYYGEEIGMLGMKPDENNREPFLWGEDSSVDTHWLQAKYTLAPDVTPLHEQKRDLHSIYNHYKKWIAFRNEHPEISTSALLFIQPEFQNLLSYTLTGPTEKLLVIHNLVGHVSSVRIADDAKIISDKDLKAEDHKINIDPFGSVIMKLPFTPGERNH